MMQVFHLKVVRAGQLNPGVVDMHARIAFRVDREALAEIFGDEAKWRELGLSFELVAEVEGDDLERARRPRLVREHRCRGEDKRRAPQHVRRRPGRSFIVDKFCFSEINTSRGPGHRRAISSAGFQRRIGNRRASASYPYSFKVRVTATPSPFIRKYSDGPCFMKLFTSFKGSVDRAKMFPDPRSTSSTASAVSTPPGSDLIKRNNR